MRSMVNGLLKHVHRIVCLTAVWGLTITSSACFEANEYTCDAAYPIESGTRYELEVRGSVQHEHACDFSEATFLEFSAPLNGRLTYRVDSEKLEHMVIGTFSMCSEEPICERPRSEDVFELKAGDRKLFVANYPDQQITDPAIAQAAPLTDMKIYPISSQYIKYIFQNTE